MAHDRKFNAYNAALGMCVTHERVIDWDMMTLVHHIEISVPGYELTSNGPKIIDINNEEIENDY